MPCQLVEWQIWSLQSQNYFKNQKIFKGNGQKQYLERVGVERRQLLPQTPCKKILFFFKDYFMNLSQ
jgi:hypothetical protein